MMTFSKLLLNLAAESMMVSLHMPVYWSSASDIYGKSIIQPKVMAMALERAMEKGY